MATRKSLVVSVLMLLNYGLLSVDRILKIRLIDLISVVPHIAMAIIARGKWRIKWAVNLRFNGCHESEDALM